MEQESRESVLVAEPIATRRNMPCADFAQGSTEGFFGQLASLRWESAHGKGKPFPLTRRSRHAAGPPHAQA
jgi:hypothetical protein